MITVANALTVGPSGIIACVLLWEHPWRLGVYLLLAHGTRRQSHLKCRPTPKSNNGILNGASFDTTVTIELRFALLNVKCFSDFSLPLPECTIYCLHALPIKFMWHQLFMDMLGNGWLGALSKSNRVAMFLLWKRSARKVSPTYSPEHVLHFTEYTALVIESVGSRSFEV